METKSEKYYHILQTLKYPEIGRLNPKMFDYLFLIPDTQKFFNWFLSNVDESCLLNDKQKFLQMASRGQVIRDLDKLKEMEKLINSTSTSINIEPSEGDWWEDCNDPDLLEQILKKKTELYEQDLTRFEKEKTINQRFKKLTTEKLIETMRAESDREIFIEKLKEKDETLKGLYKLTNQNLQKSRIEFQTKFCDESRLNINIDNLDSALEQSDTYCQNERRLIKQTSDLFMFQPKSTLSTILGDELKTKSRAYLQAIKSSYRNYIDKRLLYRCSEADLNLLKKCSENFDLFLEDLTQEKLNQGGNEKRLLIEQQIQMNQKHCQQKTEKMKEVIRRLYNRTNETYRLRELEWKLNDSKTKFISLSLFGSNQEKFGKLLNSIKSRKNFIDCLLRSKIAILENANDLLDEIIVDQNNSILPSPQLSSTHLISMPTHLISQSPSKSIENQFIHILNQFLISTLRKLDNDLNEPSPTNDGHEFKLKNPISTSFNINLDTYIDLAERIRAQYASFFTSQSFEAYFSTCFAVIKNCIRYIYDQDELNASNYGFNLIKMAFKTNVKPLDEKMTLLYKEKEELHNAFLNKIFQKYQNHKSQLKDNHLLSIKRDFFVYFYSNPKKIEAIFNHLNAQ